MPPPPNGGAVAWLQVVGSWMLFFNTWGILNTFGVYQTYYESGALFHTTSSNISWIGSIQAFMVLTVGAVSGPIYDRGHFRYLLVSGAFLVVFGHMMLSLCHEFWQCILAQGFTIGIGAGLLFVPAIAIMPTYFSTKIGLAIGLAASGSSTGGIIYPIAFYRLIDQIGFGWSVRVLGFMALATLIIPITVMKMRFKPAKARDLIDFSAFTDVPYMTFVVGTMIGYIGLYVMFFYISFYGQSQGITDESMSFYLVAILNAGSVFGRTLPNWLSDYTGPLNTIIPGTFLPCTQYCLLTNVPPYRRHYHRHTHALSPRRAQRRGAHRPGGSPGFLIGHLHRAAARHLRRADAGQEQDWYAHRNGFRDLWPGCPGGWARWWRHFAETW
jgi:MFS family permease